MSWLREEFDSPRVEIQELLERGDKVLAAITLHGRGKQSGAAASWELFHLWTIQDGRIAYGQGFRTREQAMDAAARSK